MKYEIQPVSNRSHNLSNRSHNFLFKVPQVKQIKKKKVKILMTELGPLIKRGRAH